MKNTACVSFLALFLLSLVTPHVGTAQTAGQSASGHYKFIMEDDLMKYVEFDSSTDEGGVTTGTMVFTDDARISDPDVDGTGEGSDDPDTFYMKTDFDTLTVEKNRALMSGSIVDSSHRGYIGRWVQLVVEDNGDNFERPDRLVWRICRQQPGGWIPSDAEVPGDDGAWLSWWATDAERKDDVGIPSPSLIPDEKKRCEVFSLWAYDFAVINRGEGSIVVRQ